MISHKFYSSPVSITPTSITSILLLVRQIVMFVRVVSEKITHLHGYSSMVTAGVGTCPSYCYNMVILLLHGHTPVTVTLTADLLLKESKLSGLK